MVCTFILHSSSTAAPMKANSHFSNPLWARRPSAIPVVVLMVLLTCGAVGVGVWGIIEGIHNTNSAVGDFFGVIDGFKGEVRPQAMSQ